MSIGPSRLSRLLVVLVLGFAPYEPRPMLAAVELFRGLAIQLAYRRGSGELVAADDDRAVLLWSVCHGRRSRIRIALGVTAAVCTGIVLFVVSNLILLTAVGAGMRLCGAGPGAIAEVRLCIVVIRLGVTAVRAAQAFSQDRRLIAQLPAAEGERWRVDYLAAIPQGRGHGGRLLGSFLRLADDRDAEVVLHCDSRNLPFYRRFGFRVIPDIGLGEQRMMVRLPASRRAARGTARSAARVQRRG